MAQDLTGIEIIDIAKQMERTGEAFYAAAVLHAKNPRVAEIFAMLRDEESRHAEGFEALLPRIAASFSEWRENERYLDYLRALLEDRVFPGPEQAAEAVARIDDDVTAVRMALRFEKDAILFFYELRAMVLPQDQRIVESLISEEHSHVIMLTSLLDTWISEQVAA